MKTSTSQHNLFRRCRRQCFFAYYYGGTGVDFRKPYYSLELGTALHAGMESLMRSVLLAQEKKTTIGEEAILEAINASMREWLRHEKAEFADKGEEDGEAVLFSEGRDFLHMWIRGWARTRLPEFMSEFRIVHIEKEISVDLGGTEFRSRGDVVVRDFMGDAWLVDWKTTSNPKDWKSKWGTESQSWTQPFVAERVLELKIQGVIFEGFLKWKRPLLEFYQNVDSGEVSTKYERGKNWEKVAVRDHVAFGDTPEARLKYWSGFLPAPKVRDAFLTNSKFEYDSTLADQWFSAAESLEKQIAGVVGRGDADEIRDFFYQSPGDFNCSRCVFKKVCFDRETIDDMLAEGELKIRVDHHAAARGEKENVPE